MSVNAFSEGTYWLVRSPFGTNNWNREYVCLRGDMLVFQRTNSPTDVLRSTPIRPETDIYCFGDMMVISCGSENVAMINELASVTKLWYLALKQRKGQSSMKRSSGSSSETLPAAAQGQAKPPPPDINSPTQKFSASQQQRGSLSGQSQATMKSFGGTHLKCILDDGNAIPYLRTSDVHAFKIRNRTAFAKRPANEAANATVVSEALRGDWVVCSDGGDIIAMSDAIFEKSFHHSPDLSNPFLFRSRKEYLARRMDQAFTAFIDNETTEEGESGDFLVQDDNCHQRIVDETEFEMTYSMVSMSMTRKSQVSTSSSVQTTNSTGTQSGSEEEDDDMDGDASDEEDDDDDVVEPVSKPVPPPPSRPTVSSPTTTGAKTLPTKPAPPSSKPVDQKSTADAAAASSGFYFSRLIPSVNLSKPGAKPPPPQPGAVSPSSIAAVTAADKSDKKVQKPKKTTTTTGSELRKSNDEMELAELERITLSSSSSASCSKKKIICAFRCNDKITCVSPLSNVWIQGEPGDWLLVDLLNCVEAYQASVTPSAKDVELFVWPLRNAVFSEIYEPVVLSSLPKSSKDAMQSTKLFEAMLEKQKSRLYREKGRFLAKRIDRPFAACRRGGSNLQRGKPGDVLLQDGVGEQWCMTMMQFCEEYLMLTNPVDCGITTAGCFDVEGLASSSSSMPISRSNSLVPREAVVQSVPLVAAAVSTSSVVAALVVSTDSQAKPATSPNSPSPSIDKAKPIPSPSMLKPANSSRNFETRELPTAPKLSTSISENRQPLTSTIAAVVTVVKPAALPTREPAVVNRMATMAVEVSPMLNSRQSVLSALSASSASENDAAAVDDVDDAEQTLFEKLSMSYQSTRSIALTDTIASVASTSSGSNRSLDARRRSLALSKKTVEDVLQADQAAAAVALTATTVSISATPSSSAVDGQKASTITASTAIEAEAAAVINPNKAVWGGVLMKRSRHLHVWRKRYFELFPTRLEYLRKSEKEVKDADHERYSIPLDFCKITTEDNGDSSDSSSVSVLGRINKPCRIIVIRNCGDGGMPDDEDSSRGRATASAQNEPDNNNKKFRSKTSLLGGSESAFYLQALDERSYNTFLVLLRNATLSCNRDVVFRACLADRPQDIRLVLEAVTTSTDRQFVLDSPNSEGNRPVHVAASRSPASLAEILSLGMSASISNSQGISPLHIASENGIDKCVEHLIQSNADPDVQNQQGQRPLHLASTREVTLRLVRAGGGMSAEDNNGLTPLMWTVRLGRIPSMLAILSPEANAAQASSPSDPAHALAISSINSKSWRTGFSALHYATLGLGEMENSSLVCMWKLLSKRADPNLLDLQLNTAAHIIAEGLKLGTQFLRIPDVTTLLTKAKSKEEVESAVRTMLLSGNKANSTDLIIVPGLTKAMTTDVTSKDKNDASSSSSSSLNLQLSSRIQKSIDSHLEAIETLAAYGCNLNLINSFGLSVLSLLCGMESFRQTVSLFNSPVFVSSADRPVIDMDVENMTKMFGRNQQIDLAGIMTKAAAATRLAPSATKAAAAVMSLDSVPKSPGVSQTVQAKSKELAAAAKAPPIPSRKSIGRTDSSSNLPSSSPLSSPISSPTSSASRPMSVSAVRPVTPITSPRANDPSADVQPPTGSPYSAKKSSTRPISFMPNMGVPSMSSPSASSVAAAAKSSSSSTNPPAVPSRSSKRLADVSVIPESTSEQDDDRFSDPKETVAELPGSISSLLSQNHARSRSKTSAPDFVRGLESSPTQQRSESIDQTSLIKPTLEDDRTKPFMPKGDLNLIDSLGRLYATSICLRTSIEGKAPEETKIEDAFNHQILDSLSPDFADSFLLEGVRMQDSGGLYPLHHAAVAGNMDALLFLLDVACANVNVRDNKGLTALDYVHSEILYLSKPLRLLLSVAYDVAGKAPVPPSPQILLDPASGMTQPCRCTLLAWWLIRARSLILKECERIIVSRGGKRRFKVNVPFESDSPDIVFMRLDDGGYALRGGTASAIITRLTTDETYTEADARAFFTCFKKFLSPIEVMVKVELRLLYLVSRSDASDNAVVTDDKNEDLAEIERIYGHFAHNRASIIAFIGLFFSDYYNTEEESPMSIVNPHSVKDPEVCQFLCSISEIPRDVVDSSSNPEGMNEGSHCSVAGSLLRLSKLLSEVDANSFKETVAIDLQLLLQQQSMAARFDGAVNFWANGPQSAAGEASSAPTGNPSVVLWKHRSVRRLGTTVDSNSKEMESLLAVVLPQSSKAMKKAAKVLGGDVLGQASKNKTLLDFRPNDIARQMTFASHFLLCRIQPSELLSLNYRDDDLCPNLSALRRWNELLQKAFLNFVLSPDSPSDRAERILHLMALAEECISSVSNFDGAYVVVTVLESCAIFRLKSTWSRVEKKAPGKWQEFKDDVGIGGRKLLNGMIHSTPPFVPYLGVLMSNLISVNELPSQIEEANNGEEKRGILINLAKFKKMDKVMSIFRLSQMKTYPFAPDSNILNFITMVQTLNTEREFDGRSNQVEPGERQSATSGKWF